MRRLLIIEDEVVLRSSLQRGLSTLSNVQAIGAGSLVEGLRCIDDNAPDMVLSDIDLPDRPGIELIGELGRRGLNIPVVFMSAYLKAYAAQIPRHANVHVLEKPVGLEHLRTLVRDSLDTGNESINPFSVPDYLQLACMGRHSVRIAVDEGNAGEIIIVQGRLWTARDPKGEGADAFRRLASASWQSVHCETYTGVPGEQTISEDWQGLLLDTARRVDEGADFNVDFDGTFDMDGESHTPDSDSNSAPKPFPSGDADEFSFEAQGASPQTSAAPAAPAQSTAEAEEFDGLIVKATEAILDRRYDEALETLLKASALRNDDPRVTANLKRLEQLGFTPR